MGTPTTVNLIKTGGIIYYAPEGEAAPDETSVAAGASWGGNWARVGYTKAPTDALYEFSEHESMVEEILGPVKRYRIDEHFTVETVLAELEADYLALVASGTVSDTGAGASQKAYEELDVGDVADLTVREWGIEGEYTDSAGNTQAIRYFFKGTANINGAMQFSKKNDDYTGIPIQIKALADTSNSNRMFRFQRMTADATA